MEKFDATDAGIIAATGPTGVPIVAARKSGLLRGLTDTSTPNKGIAQLDEGTQGLINTQLGRAGQSADEVTQQQLQGTEKAAAGLPGAEQFNQQATALGMAQPEDLGKQLSERAQKYFGNDMIKLQNQANMNSGKIIADRQRAALGSAEGQQKLHEQAYNTALQNENAKRKARGQVIGSLLGIAGTVGGAAIGGGAGAGAGGKVGQGLGNSAGGSTTDASGVA